MLQDAFNQIYEQTVPENERKDIENLIRNEALEEAERREAARCFAVNHMHDGEDDFHFTTDICTNFSTSVKSTVTIHIIVYPR